MTSTTISNVNHTISITSSAVLAAGPEKNDKKPILEKLPKKRKCTDMPQSTLHKFVALMGLVMFLCDLDQGHEGYVKVTRKWSNKTIYYN